MNACCAKPRSWKIIKKRSAREREDAIRFANESLLKDLLPVVDNLERADRPCVGRRQWQAAGRRRGDGA